MFFKERKKKLAYCFVDSKVHQEEEVVSARKKKSIRQEEEVRSARKKKLDPGHRHHFVALAL